MRVGEKVGNLGSPEVTALRLSGHFAVVIYCSSSLYNGAALSCVYPQLHRILAGCQAAAWVNLKASLYSAVKQNGRPSIQRSINPQYASKVRSVSPTLRAHKLLSTQTFSSLTETTSLPTTRCRQTLRPTPAYRTFTKTRRTYPKQHTCCPLSRLQARKHGNGSTKQKSRSVCPISFSQLEQVHTRSAAQSGVARR